MTRRPPVVAAAHLVASVRRARRGSRWLVVLDDESEVSIPGAAAARLQIEPGCDAPAELGRWAQPGADRADAHEVALRLLSVRDRSEAEMSACLHASAFTAATVDAEVAALVVAGLLDDGRFAQSYIAGRERSAPRGQRLLRQELRARGIDAELAEGLTGAVEELPAATALARSRAARRRAQSYLELESSVGAFLARRGFGYEVVRAALRTVWSELASEGGDLGSDGPDPTGGDR